MGRDVRDVRDDKCRVPRARTRAGFMWAIWAGFEKSIQRLQTSSLTSLSSLKGGQDIEKTGKDLGAVALFVVPVSVSVVPVVPVNFGQFQDVV